MRSFALSTGSSGNCYYVESDNGTRLIVDLGLSFKKSKEILSSRGIDIEKIDAVLITHEHSDHVIGFESFFKKLSCPFYLTKGTSEGIKVRDKKINYITKNQRFKVGEITVFVVESSHDAREPVSFVFENGLKLGIFTDLGEIDLNIREIMRGLDHIYIETNYCDLMLKQESKYLNSNYVSRVVSNKGHLSVNQAVLVLKDILKDSQKIILSHVSENTNTYENVYLKVKQVIDSCNVNVDLFVSFQGEATEWIG